MYHKLHWSYSISDEHRTVLMQGYSQRLRDKAGGEGWGWGWGGGTSDCGLVCLAHDLPGSSVSGHARLGGPLVGAHLQADDVLPLLNLVVGKISAVLLRFLEEPVRIAPEHAIFLGDSEASNGHKCPLH